jgi:hypothetical protein
LVVTNLVKNGAATCRSSSQLPSRTKTAGEKLGDEGGDGRETTSIGRWGAANTTTQEASADRDLGQLQVAA